MTLEGLKPVVLCEQKGPPKPREMSGELRGSLKELPSGRTKLRVTDVGETYGRW